MQIDLVLVRADTEMARRSPAHARSYMPDYALLSNTQPSVEGRIVL